MAQIDSVVLAPLVDTPLTADELDRTGLVDFEVERDSEIPVGTQLRWKLKAMVARGALRPGDRVPSVRELAGFAGVNVNTARAAYVHLEDEGLIASEQGRGTYVTDRASELEDLDGLVRDTIARARAEGIDRADLAGAIWAAGAAENRAELPELPLPPLDPAAGAAILRRELRAQIARIETELATYAWHDPRRPAPDRVETANPVGRVTSVEELQRTRDDLIERLTRLRGEAERRGAREQAGRAHVNRMLEDPASHRWEIVTSDQTGDPGGCRNWRVVPKWGPLGAIMGWWRVKVSSGCPLAGPLAAVPQKSAVGSSRESTRDGQISSR